MNGLLHSFAEVFILACTFIHTYFMRVRAVKALVRLLHAQMRLSICPLFDNTMSIENQMRRPVF